MQIKEIERSPFPGLASIRTTHLVLSQREIAALERARSICADIWEAFVENNAYGDSAVGEEIAPGSAEAWLSVLLETHRRQGIRIINPKATDHK